MAGLTAAARTRHDLLRRVARVRCGDSQGTDELPSRYDLDAPTSTSGLARPKTVAQSSAPTIQRLLGNPWNNLPTLYKSPAQTKLIPDAVKNALTAYFGVATPGTSTETQADRLRTLHTAAIQWERAMHTAFPPSVFIGGAFGWMQTTPVDEDWVKRISSSLIESVEDELASLDWDGMPQGSLSDGYSTVDGAFRAMGVRATRFVPANEISSAQTEEASANPTFRITYRFGGSAKGVKYTGYFKAEKPKLDKREQGAVKFGVPEENPQLSARSVATYELAKELGVKEIPHTAYAVHEVGGSYYPGSIMESAGTVTVHEFAQETKADISARAGFRSSLARLQMFDLITGQTDRHHENIRVSPETGGIHGIDNDLAFGELDNLEDRALFGKVNTLPFHDLVADAGFARDLAALVEEGRRLEDVKRVVEKHLGGRAAAAMAARLEHLLKMLERDKERIAQGWRGTSAKYSVVIPGVGGFPAHF